MGKLALWSQILIGTVIGYSLVIALSLILSICFSSNSLDINDRILMEEICKNERYNSLKICDVFRRKYPKNE